MTWFSSVFTLSSSQSSTFLIVYHSLCVLSKRFSLGITEMVSSSGILSKSLDGQARVCSSSHRGVSQWKKASFLNAELLEQLRNNHRFQPFPGNWDETEEIWQGMERLLMQIWYYLELCSGKVHCQRSIRSAFGQRWKLQVQAVMRDLICTIF